MEQDTAEQANGFHVKVSQVKLVQKTNNPAGSSPYNAMLAIITIEKQALNKLSPHGPVHVLTCCQPGQNHDADGQFPCTCVHDSNGSLSSIVLLLALYSWKILTFHENSPRLILSLAVLL